MQEYQRPTSDFTKDNRRTKTKLAVIGLLLGSLAGVGYYYSRNNN